MPSAASLNVSAVLLGDFVIPFDIAAEHRIGGGVNRNAGDPLLSIGMDNRLDAEHLVSKSGKCHGAYLANR